MKKILAINGSADSNGSNYQLLQLIADQFSSNYHISVYSGLGELPLFTPTKLIAAIPDEVAELKKSIVDSEAIILCTPEYLHNIPAVLKNALEWLTESGELANKPVLPITFTPQEPRGAFAMVSLTNSLQASKAKVVAKLSLYQDELRTESGTFSLQNDFRPLIEEALKLL